MAESTLSIDYDSLREEIAFYLGYGRSSANWSTDQTSSINSVLKSGLRQFYAPPRLPGDATTHSWHFMNPVTTLTTGTTTGTMSGTATTTLTATTSVFSSRMANPLSDFATTVTFTTSGTSYTISGYTSGTVVTLSSTAAAEASGDTFTISAQRDFDLPDDFGGMNGTFTYSSSNYHGEIKRIAENQLREFRRGNTTAGFPIYCAIRPLTTAGTSVGQRFEVMFYPNPDATYILSYSYTPLTDVLNGTIIYPYGGATHAETILCSCLAVAEQRLDDRKGEKWNDFMQKLQTSIDLDREAWTPESLGYNKNTAHGMISDYRNDNSVTVEGSSVS